jgi:DDE domain
MKRHGRPETIVTDRLRSYGAALKDLGRGDDREVGRLLNNRAENPHLPFRRRERGMLRFRRMRTLQKFASVHASVHNHFPTERHLQDRNAFTQARATALADWRGLLAARMNRRAGVTETGSHSSDSTMKIVPQSTRRSSPSGLPWLLRKIGSSRAICASVSQTRMLICLSHSED